MMRHINNTGMRWFDFFYKFVIPIGMVFSFLMCLGYIAGSFNQKDGMLYVMEIPLQLTHFILSLSIFLNYRHSKSLGNIGYSPMLYYLTIAIVVYISIRIMFNNIYESFVFIPYMILNIIYFRKRKRLFGL